MKAAVPSRKAQATKAKRDVFICICGQCKQKLTINIIRELSENKLKSKVHRGYHMLNPTNDT